MSREMLLTRTLVELADTLVDDFDIVDTLTLLTDRCVTILDVAAAGLMLARPSGSLRVMASSSDSMRILELFEIQAEEGPCLDALQTGEPVSNPDLAASADRWPRFAPEAIGAGYRAAHAVPMRLRGTVIGALNLFHTTAGPLSADDLHVAGAFADVATIAILQHRAAVEAEAINAQLNHALSSRIVIEQAKGMVAERLGLDVDTAFAVLRAHARDHNLLLADLARDVITGVVATSGMASPPERH